MKRILIIILLIFNANNAIAESSFLPDIDTITKFFEASKQTTPKSMTEKYQFLKEKKRVNGKGTYSVSCFTENGTPIPLVTELQVDTVKTGILTYDLITLDHKFMKVPISHCYIKEN